MISFHTFNIGYLIHYNMLIFFIRLIIYIYNYYNKLKIALYNIEKINHCKTLYF